MAHGVGQDTQDRYYHHPALTAQAHPQAAPDQKCVKFLSISPLKLTFSFASFLSFSFLTIFALNLSLNIISLCLLFFLIFSFCFFDRRTISSSVDDSLLASAWSDSVLLSSLEPEMMSLSPLLVSAQPSWSLISMLWLYILSGTRCWGYNKQSEKKKGRSISIPTVML